MKKIIIFILLIFMLLILTGCNNKEYKSDKKFSHFDVVIIGGKLFYVPVYMEVEDE